MQAFSPGTETSHNRLVRIKWFGKEIIRSDTGTRAKVAVIARCLVATAIYMSVENRLGRQDIPLHEPQVTFQTLAGS